VAGRQPPELTAQALRTGRLDIPMGPPDGLQWYASIGIGHRNLRRHVEPSQSRLPRLELDERLGVGSGESATSPLGQWLGLATE
jgi:hypothetical protein